jgi:hypothetical protein
VRTGGSPGKFTVTDPVAVALFDSVREVPLLLDTTVVPLGIPVPTMDSPAVIAPVGKVPVTVVDPDVVPTLGTLASQLLFGAA